MSSIRSLRLSSLLVIALLGVIAVMLIVPNIDPPDTAFQNNTAPVVVHSVSHHVPQGNDHSRALDIQFRFDDYSNHSSKLLFHGRKLILSFVSRQILRC